MRKEGDLVINNPIEKRYFNHKEACEILNNEFEFKGKDIILPYDLSRWHKMGFIYYQNAHKVSSKELKSIRGFVYLRCYLGIEYRKLAETQEYLKDISYGRILELNELKTYIYLYERNNK